MLKRAVETHNATTATKKTLAQQLFSSSPPVQQDLKQYHQPSRPHARPLSTGTHNAARPNTSSTGSSYQWRDKEVSAGIKRTASGLAKALITDDPFSYPSFRPSNSLENPILIDDALTPKRKPSAAVEEIYFNENDFDSDVDLDVEDPSTKSSISYPKLPLEPEAMSLSTMKPPPPKVRREKPPIFQSIDSGYVSQMPGAFQTEESPPKSSGVSLPWSSSPAEHFRTPPKPPSIQQFVYQPIDRISTTETQSLPSEKSRPAKRRTLPWLEEQEDEPIRASDLAEQVAAYGKTPVSGRKGPAATSAGDFTPLPKNSPKTSYPWNTTASAIKVQQKNLREANKKNGKKHMKIKEATEDSLIKAKATKKNGSVYRVFLSEEQQHVLNIVLNDHKSVFFTGSAGTGKSVLLREIISALRKKYAREPERVAVTASTGLAACNVGGVTIHSFAGIGLGKEPVEQLVRKIKNNQKAKHRWMRTKVLIIDEVSMVDGELFDKLEEIARRIRSNGRPFGGIQLVITGDFFQLPPVPDNGKIAKFAFDAGSWNTTIEHTIGLHHVFRQKDPVFAGMLNEMREGLLTPESIRIFKKLDRQIDFGDGMETTELFPTRAEVDAANNYRMQHLQGDVKWFEAKDAGTVTDRKFRDKLLQNCMAPEKLYLKKGSQVMLIKNIDETLVNGTLGRVVGFMSEQTFDRYQENEEEFLQKNDEDDAGFLASQPQGRFEQLANTNLKWPVVRFAIADGTTRELLLQREVWKVELPNGEVQASRAQVPLILAWALSIHKAQGQTLPRVKVDLGKVFEKGQAYVALSRATSMQGLQVLRFDPKKVVAHERVRTFYAGLSRAEQAGRSARE